MPKYQISPKICSVKGELFHVDGLTVRGTERQDEATSRSSKFCDRVRKCIMVCIWSTRYSCYISIKR